jgi:hypothetical protein
MSFDPELARDRSCIAAGFLPPSSFVTGAVDLAMMSAAERYGELVAYLETETATLREAQMVGVAGQSCTDQAGLPGDKPKVDLIAKATRLRNGKQALIDCMRYTHFGWRSLLYWLRSLPVLKLHWWTRRRGGFRYCCVRVA